MSRISRNISVILRAERLIAQRHFTFAIRRTGLYAAAGIAVGLAVVMLNVAGYLALSAVMSKPMSALIIAGADLLIAMILALLAANLNTQADTAAAVELRDIALQDIEAEIHDGLAEARDTVANIKRASHDPLGMVAPGLVGMIVNALIKYARSQKESSETDKTASN